MNIKTIAVALLLLLGITITAFAGQIKLASADTSSGQPVTDASTIASSALISPIPDTGQTLCYDDSDTIICPEEGEAFYGQDAQITGNTPSYTDNGDGTITDNVTGLMWQKSDRYRW